MGQQFSKATPEEVVSGLVFAIRQKAESLYLHDSERVIMIGLKPISAAAEEWLDAKEKEGIILHVVPLSERRGLTTKMLEHAEEIVGLMQKNKENVQSDMNKGIPYANRSYEMCAADGVTVYFEVIEHDYSRSPSGGSLALDIHVYIGGKGLEQSEKIAWAAEEFISEWARENNDMWTQTHNQA